jgi:hypothetical protein
MYLIDRFLSTEQGKELLSRFHFIFVPVANPDGYVHTWTENRLWRKNRRPNYILSKVFRVFKQVETWLPYGVDLNRNYANHWCETGGSSNPASEIYCGPGEGSEPEIQALQNAFKEILKNHVVLGVFDIHSYGQLIMYPYGWCNKPCPHEAFMRAAVERMSNVIKSTTFATYHPMATSGLYPNSGSSTDWYYETACQAGMPVYSLVMELRPGDDVLAGFSVDPSEISSAGEDVWSGLREFAYFAHSNPLG